MAHSQGKTSTDIQQAEGARPWAHEARATLKLGWPLIVAQLSNMALNTTDVVMMGWLGPEFLAAGVLAHSTQYPVILFATGILLAAGPMIAQALGAKDVRSVRRTVRQCIWISALAALFLSPLLMNGDLLLRALGQDPATTDLVRTYLSIAAWQLFPALMFIALRSLSAAHNETAIVVWVTAVGIVVNGVLNYTLMFGHFGFPRLELMGAGIATTAVQSVMTLLLLLYVLRHRRMRRYSILGRLWRPDWPRFWSMFRLGFPIGLMLLAECMLFSGAAVLMGWLGTEQLAAHAVALQLAALSFMVPMGLSQATTIRVGHAHGRGDIAGQARAGWVSLGLSVLFMAAVALLFLLAPRPLIHLFFDPQDPMNAVPIKLAVGYLAIAGLFQLADGAQVTASASLRGVSDTKVPAIIAFVCYWCVGLPTAYVLGFWLNLGGTGIWLGLVSGLSLAAVSLVLRFRSLQSSVFSAVGINDTRPDPTPLHQSKSVAT